MTLLTRTITPLFFICCIFSCKKSDTALDTAETTLYNIAYGTDYEQRMDVYLPPNRSMGKTPSLILIHGGAWRTGDKQEFNQFVDTLKVKMPGCAIFNINYRLFDGINNPFPTQENDISACLHFIKNNLSRYNISSKTALLGASAGGHLALLQGYKQNKGLEIKAIVDFFGPTSIDDLYFYPIKSKVQPLFIIALLNYQSPYSDAAAYHNSSPINHVSKTSPPTIIFQGGSDKLVPQRQSEDLYTKLRQAGVEAKLQIYPEAGHGWHGLLLADSFSKFINFLNLHLYD